MRKEDDVRVSYLLYHPLGGSNSVRPLVELIFPLREGGFYLFETRLTV